MKDHEAALKLININKSFVNVPVLENVNFTLHHGRIMGLCGENGAGKSTLMNIIGGVHPYDSGEMYIDGQRYKPNNPNDAIKSGIAFIHQELNLFPNLTVRQNFMLDDLPINRFGIINNKIIKETISKNLNRVIEGIDIDKNIQYFKMGQKQLIEIAKEISKRAKIIIFDEPTTSLSTKEKEILFKIIKELSASGIQIIYISHIIDDIMNICDDISVLRNGVIVGGGKIDDFTIADIVKMMIGRSVNNLYPYIQKNPPGKELLKISDLTSGSVLKSINMTLREGEIVGLFGLMGAGRSELARAIFGVYKYDRGEIFINGQKIKKSKAEKIKARGVAFITENRHEEGLLMPKSLKDNIVLADLKGISRKFFIDRKDELSRCNEIKDKLKIKTWDVKKQLAQQLSGGNQQKVVIGKWLLTKSNIFILDEPTRGVDVGSKFEIYNYINEVAINKSGVLFISSEMEELIGICDRILIMSKGSIQGELNRTDFSQEDILKLAIGGES